MNRHRGSSSKFIVRWVFALVTALLASGLARVWAEDAPATDCEETPRERLQVDAWVGEVINKFAAADRTNALEPKGDVDKGDIDRFAGLAVDLKIFQHTWTCEPKAGSKRAASGKPHKPKTGSFHAFIEAMHTARVVEAQCTAGDPDCATDDSGNPIANPENFVKIIKDSNVLEWHAGFRFDVRFDNELIFYAKARAGLIRSVDSGDDVIDDHFVGFGLEYVDCKSWFRNSRAEAGWGRTDFFATNRTRRTKVDARLVISKPPDNISKPPDNAVLNFFLEGYLDSDFGKGSDDIRIFLGVGFDIREVFKKRQQK